MADTISPPQFDFEPAFVRRAMRYLDRAISQGELTTLQQELQADPLKRNTLVELCVSQSELFEEFSQEAHDARDRKGSDRNDSFLVLLERAAHGQPRELAETSELGDSNSLPPPADAASTTGAGRWRTWRIAAAILLPLLLGAILWRLYVAAGRAFVAQSLDAKLDGISPAATANALPSGPHTLNQGFMQVELGGGAEVVLQAPANFQVLGRARVSLTSGRLTASVPHGSAGLTVETPDVTAVDLGTEFGVDVQPGVRSHIEVFQGQVRAETHLPNTPSTSHTLNANEAIVVIKGSATIQPAAAAPLAFIRVPELTARVQSTDPTGYDRWRQFSQQLRADPDLVAYYPFDNEKQDPASLLNRADGAGGLFNGRLGFDGSQSSRPTWTSGRWPGKGALHFGAEGPTAVIVPADPRLIPTNAITIAFWIKRSQLRDPVHLLYAAPGGKMEFDVGLGGTSKANPKVKPRSIFFDWESHGTSVSAPSVLPTDHEWCFIAITAAPDDQAKFYVNGVHRYTRATLPFDKLRPSDLYIGMALTKLGAEPQEIFKGEMDELAILRRALSGEEIQRMYDAGQPH